MQNFVYLFKILIINIEFDFFQIIFINKILRSYEKVNI